MLLYQHTCSNDMLNGPVKTAQAGPLRLTGILFPQVYYTTSPTTLTGLLSQKAYCNHMPTLLQADYVRSPTPRTGLLQPAIVLTVRYTNETDITTYYMLIYKEAYYCRSLIFASRRFSLAHLPASRRCELVSMVRSS